MHTGPECYPRGMTAPVLRGPFPNAGATAYLVGWQDPKTGLFEDAGIYSEGSPTMPDMHGPRPIALLAVQSRFDPRQGGYERASSQLHDMVRNTPSLAWVTRTRTFQLMERNRTTVRRGTRLVARHVVR